MTPLLQYATTALALALAVAAAVCALRDRLPGWSTVGGLVVLEAALIAVMVVGLVQVVRTDRNVAAADLVGYLVTIPLLVPVAVGWAIVDRTRYGTAVIVVACLAVAVMLARTRQIWDLGVV